MAAAKSTTQKGVQVNGNQRGVSRVRAEIGKGINSFRQLSNISTASIIDMLDGVMSTTETNATLRMTGQQIRLVETQVRHGSGKPRKDALKIIEG